MKKLLFFVATLFTLSTVTAQDNSDKTLVKTLNPENSTSVKLDFQSHEIQPQIWDEGTMRVELIIKANMPEQVLAQLIKAGRYTLEGVKNGDTYYVTAPNLAKTVNVRGRDLEEQITVVVKTPGYFALQENTLSKNEEFFAARSLDPEKAAQQIKEFRQIDNDMNINIMVESTFKSAVKLELKTGDILIGGEPLTIE